jgi:Dolichyl-phosphate-mannose-protein mannosyltransferase
MVELLSLNLKRLWQYAVDRAIALPLAGLLLILVLVTSPVGEFPLNDDWIYSKTVQHLLETGQYKAHPYLNATLIAQSYWGAMFCKIFGFRFTVLRISTLVLAFVNAWAVAKSGIVLGFSRNLALLCGAMVATSPLVLQLSYSFMTDVPFLAMSNLSGFFFLKALRYPRPQLIAWGSVTAALAFFVRQFGILLAIAFVITAAWLVWRKRYVWTSAMTVAILMPWLAAIGLYVGWGNALTSETPILEVPKSYAGPLLDALRHVPVAMCYLGLFALPLGIGRIAQMIRGREGWSGRRKFVLIGFCGFSVFTFWFPQILYGLSNLIFRRDAPWLRQYPVRMPLIMYRSLLDLGLGPLQLPDPQFKPTVQLGEWWWILTVPVVMVAGLLFVALIDRGWSGCMYKPSGLQQNPIHQNQDLFLVSWAVLSLAATYNPFRAVLVDRYLLVALVPFILLLGRDLMQHPLNLKRALKPIMIGTMAIAIFSIASLQEYMDWNRTAWVAHHKLETKYHVDSKVIEGIDTYNGWFNSEAYMVAHNTRSWWDAVEEGKSPWVLDNQYVVASTEPRSGYQVLERIPYFSWLGWKERKIVLFRRSNVEAKP